jgi:hypothetical protein
VSTAAPQATATLVEGMKRAAKRMVREAGIPHHAALEMVAKAKGFNSWHAVTLARTQAERTSRERPFR